MSNHLEPIGVRDHGWLGQLDPRLKLAWLAWVSWHCVWLVAPESLAVLAGLCALAASGLRLPWRATLVLVLAVVLAAWSTLLSQAMFYAGTPRTAWLTVVPEGHWHRWSWSGLHLYREGAWYGMTQSTRFIALTLAGFTMAWSTSPARLMAALAACRVPTWLSFMVSSALGFLPQLASAWRTVHAARRLRRADDGSCETWRQLTAVPELLLPVLAVALRRAETLSAAVSSRGFDPTQPRTTFPPLQFRGAERFALWLLGGSAAVVVGMKIVTALHQYGRWSCPALGDIYTATTRWL